MLVSADSAPPIAPGTRRAFAGFAAAAMRRVVRWRTAAFQAAGAVMFVSEDPDRRASCRKILHPIGRVTWISSGVVARTRADLPCVIESRFRLLVIESTTGGVRQ